MNAGQYVCFVFSQSVQTGTTMASCFPGKCIHQTGFYTRSSVCGDPFLKTFKVSCVRASFPDENLDELNCHVIYLVFSGNYFKNSN